MFAMIDGQKDLDSTANFFSYRHQNEIETMLILMMIIMALVSKIFINEISNIKLQASINLGSLQMACTGNISTSISITSCFRI